MILQSLSEFSTRGFSHDLTIITAGTLNGTFDTVPAGGKHLGYGVIFDAITYDPNSGEVVVSLTQGLVADFNSDNIVNSADLCAWQAGMACHPVLDYLMVMPTEMEMLTG